MSHQSNLPMPTAHQPSQDDERIVRRGRGVLPIVMGGLPGNDTAQGALSLQLTERPQGIVQKHGEHRGSR